MIYHIYQAIPEKLRLAIDACAIATVGMTWTDVFSGIAAGLASLAAFVYTVIRTYYFLGDRKEKK